MTAPFFTIVTPTLNSERYLEACVESVERQPFIDWEHVFVDGYSSDRTMHILEAYQARHPDKVFVHQFPKAGIADAFNKGIEQSTGRYLNFLGSDDLLEADALQVVHTALRDGTYSWCYGDATLIDGQGQVIERKTYAPFVYDRLFYFFYICHQSVFMRRAIFDRYGLFDTSLQYSMDHEYFLRVGRRELPLKLRAYLCQHRQSRSGVTTVNWKQTLREKRISHLRYGSALQKSASPFVVLAVHLKRLFVRNRAKT